MNFVQFKLVQRLENKNNIPSFNHEPGNRNLNYGVTDDQYDTVGATLIPAQEQEPGDAFDSDVTNAWIESCTLISNAKIEGTNASMNTMSASTVNESPPPEVASVDNSLKDQLRGEIKHLREEIERVGKVAGEIGDIANSLCA